MPICPVPWTLVCLFDMFAAQAHWSCSMLMYIGA